MVLVNNKIVDDDIIPKMFIYYRWLGQSVDMMIMLKIQWYEILVFIFSKHFHDAGLLTEKLLIQNVITKTG